MRRRSHLLALLVLASAPSLLSSLPAYAQQPDAPEPLVEPPSTEEEEVSEPDSVASEESESESDASQEPAPQEPALQEEPLDEAQRRYEALFGGYDPRAQQTSVPSEPGLTRTWLVPEAQLDAPPQLAFDTPTTCLMREGQNANLHMQCDHQARHCLIAETHVFKEASPDSPTLVPTSREASHLSYCDAGYGSERDLDLLAQRGYTFEPALLAAPYGYKRDHRGRVFQIHFDLRSRMLLGVYHTAFVDESGPHNTLAVETRSSYEHFSTSRLRRHRFGFVEGQLTLSPLRANATLFQYDMGRAGDEPLLYITEFFGEPSRHDIKLNLGRGLMLGHIDYRARQSADDLLFLDFAQGWLQWELLQGLGLEDYAMLRIGGGMGTRARGEDAVYVYPELGFKAKWLKSPRGLFELSTQGRLRYSVEPATDTRWVTATALASAEWVLISVSDQPISLFLAPQADYITFDNGSKGLSEFKVLSGVRVSLFTPAPEDPAEIERAIQRGGY